MSCTLSLYVITYIFEALRDNLTMKIIHIICIIILTISINKHVIPQSDTRQEKVVLSPDIDAIFPKGMEAFYDYVGKNIK